MRGGILKAYLPCVLVFPVFLWLAVAAGHAWGLIPYTLGNFLMSLGFMQLYKRLGELDAQSRAHLRSTA
jgi:hypothetical protein